MTEKPKVTLEELQKTISDVKELAEKSRVELEELIRKKPMESAGFIFIAGIVLGILLGASTARRN